MGLSLLSPQWRLSQLFRRYSEKSAVPWAGWFQSAVCWLPWLAFLPDWVLYSKMLLSTRKHGSSAQKKLSAGKKVWLTGIRVWLMLMPEILKAMLHGILNLKITGKQEIRFCWMTWNKAGRILKLLLMNSILLIISKKVQKCSGRSGTILFPAGMASGTNSGQISLKTGHSAWMNLLKSFRAGAQI